MFSNKELLNINKRRKAKPKVVDRPSQSQTAPNLEDDPSKARTGSIEPEEVALSSNENEEPPDIELGARGPQEAAGHEIREQHFQQYAENLLSQQRHQVQEAYKSLHSMAVDEEEREFDFGSVKDDQSVGLSKRITTGKPAFLASNRRKMEPERDLGEGSQQRALVDVRELKDAQALRVDQTI